MLKRFIILLTTIVFFFSCRTVSSFNAPAFQRTAMLKARLLVLMTHATEPYEKYNNAADSILVESNALYAIEKAMAKNENSVRQWDQVLAGNTSILPGFFAIWKLKKTLPEPFTIEAKYEISAAFDEILKLQKSKLKY